MQKRILIIITLFTAWILTYFNLQSISDFFVEDVLQMESGKHLTESLRFFIYEVPKVMLLLVLIIFFVGFIRTYFSAEKTRKALENSQTRLDEILGQLENSMQEISEN